MSVAMKRNQNPTRDLKHRVLTCLHKLSDRDTHSAAAAELESIAKTLSSETIPPFLSSISAVDSADKSPVRKQCLRLISLLSEQHRDTLSPHLSKVLSAVVRRLRDPDSAVRTACVTACTSISSNLTQPPFSSIIKPFLEALFTEQEMNAQIAAALCLSAAIEASPEPDVVCLRKLLPRFEKLLKCGSFKAKAAVLTLIGSVIGVGGASNQQTMRNLVPYLVEFMSSEDWAARKASVEALLRLAIVERDSLSEFKTSCLKTFEAKRYDKVKAVRETMNQMLEVWKEIPDLSDDDSPLPQSNSSSKENASDGRYPPSVKTSYTMSSGAPSVRKKQAHKPASADGSSARTALKGRLSNTFEKKSTPAIFRKLDHKKPSESKVEISAPLGTPGTRTSENETKNKEGRLADKDEEMEQQTKLEVQRTLFSKISGERKPGILRAGSRVVPYLNERSESTVIVSNETGDLYRNPKECEFEDLSQIRKQLVQIENQQSSLFELLQRFIGSSESGMRSLGTRVQGLELALDEISFDFVMSTGRKSRTDSAAMCCKLPGAEFFSSKLWKRKGGRSSTSRSSAHGETSSGGAVSRKAGEHGDGERFNLERGRSRFRGNHGFIVNPLAKMHPESQGISEPSSSGVSNNFCNGV
ncbi:PREDICTED: microtubule-associated protein TORTIFOLIA1-like [Nicotiana attenuata]|uniref:Microtubule-associated protein tortifolia1 n=1 Tax=Nicotiana attenuata TaxID=49451 RepID=A0A314KNQ4_NICAT|nr:PREDICTED: microtubule-associated protein TORTIFOLIA1-like [Nicotiana attenuata]OIT30364.1 microtubule-associated protein tortifolia1 [Nicotiana attenuata]